MEGSTVSIYDVVLNYLNGKKQGKNRLQALNELYLVHHPLNKWSRGRNKQVIDELIDLNLVKEDGKMISGYSV